MNFEVYNHEWIEGVDSRGSGVGGADMGREVNLDDENSEVSHACHVEPDDDKGADSGDHGWHGAQDLPGDFGEYDDPKLHQESSEVGLGEDMARYQDWR